METLRRHFYGEGNATQNLVEAEGVNESLHYKSEREISIKISLTQFQKMLNIYEREGEEMSDEAKLRFLFRKIQHTGLRSSNDAINIHRQWV